MELPVFPVWNATQSENDYHCTVKYDICDKQESALIREKISQRSLTVGELVGGIMEKYQECIFS